MKRVFAIVCAVLLTALCAIPCFAAPVQNPAGGEIGGALSMEASIELKQAVEYQLGFVNSSVYFSTGCEAGFITATDNGADMWTYSVYLMPPSSKVEALFQEWAVAGADLTISGTNYLYKCSYNFAPSGGMGYPSYTMLNNGVLALADKEQVVYMWKGSAASGLSPIFPWGFYSSERTCIRNWVNAYNAFEGYLTPEIVEDEVENARNEGVNEGYRLGYDEGVSITEKYWTGIMPELEAAARDEGYDEGYEDAVEDYGADELRPQVIDIPAIFSAIPAAAKSIINNAFGFELFGINVAGLLSVLLIISVVGFIVAKLSKG